MGQAGVSGDGSGFTSGNPAAPQGGQVAFLQNTGSFSEAVTLAAGTHSISFSAAQRAMYQSSSQTFQVLVDGVRVATFTPTGTSYATYSTGAFAVEDGIHTITFVGLNPNGGDNTAFIDQVTISSAPPGALHGPTLGSRIPGHGESHKHHSRAMNHVPDCGWWMGSGGPTDRHHREHRGEEHEGHRGGKTEGHPKCR